MLPFPRSRRDWRLKCWDMSKSLACWLSDSMNRSHLVSYYPLTLPPSLHPSVILGIYSWPPSVYNLNYLSREMRSLHNSETGFYMYHLIPLKLTKCRSCCDNFATLPPAIVNWCSILIYLVYLSSFYDFIIIILFSSICLLQNNYTKSSIIKS